MKLQYGEPPWTRLDTFAVCATITIFLLAAYGLIRLVMDIL